MDISNNTDISNNIGINVINKEKEVIRFYYFSELGLCGDNKTRHQHYCDNMLKHGYTLKSLTPIGNLDNNRDSYEGTIIYHWMLRDES